MKTGNYLLRAAWEYAFNVLIALGGTIVLGLLIVCFVLQEMGVDLFDLFFH